MKTINAKQLRLSLPDIVRRVRRGERFVVLYRSHPAFRLVPINDEGDVVVDDHLETEPLLGAPAVGASTDGLSSDSHDDILYGGRR